MCGRVIQSLGLSAWPLLKGLMSATAALANVRPSYNAAPRQELLVIRQNHKTGERSTAHLTPPPSISVAIGVFTLAI